MKEYLFRHQPPYPLDVVNAKDSYVIDKSGKKYLDFLVGWCVGNAGWNKTSIMNAVKSFKGPVYVMPPFKYSRWEILAQKLVNLMPGKNGTCFRATGGTEAVEIALKISRAFNKRKKFIAFRDAYHGQSLACMALVDLYQDKFGPYSDNFVRVNADKWEETTDFVVNQIKKEEVCAFISEPIICALGVIIPPKSFFEAVQEACKQTNTAFIMDEVATGFGRTGKWFGFEHYKLKPDIVTVAKGFSSGYGGLGATIATPEIAETMRFDFSNYSTFGWHPLSTEAAIANLDYIKKNKLVEKSVSNGAYLMKKLSQFCNPEGKGLCIGFNCANKNMEMDCFKDKLLLSYINNRTVLFPALDVKKKEMDEAVEIVRKNHR
ncbi:aspartate aminotransferase family protein [Candidatus Woesearchaeota archaeon]|nr:aspartate aminotransferase family protein [Candidatus Woesearchaeota archaeon]